MHDDVGCACDLNTHRSPASRAGPAGAAIRIGAASNSGRPEGRPLSACDGFEAGYTPEFDRPPLMWIVCPVM